MKLEIVIILIVILFLIVSEVEGKSVRKVGILTSGRSLNKTRTTMRRKDVYSISSIAINNYFEERQLQDRKCGENEYFGPSKQCESCIALCRINPAECERICPSVYTNSKYNLDEVWDNINYLKTTNAILFALVGVLTVIVLLLMAWNVVKCNYRKKKTIDAPLKRAPSSILTTSPPPTPPPIYKNSNNKDDIDSSSCTSLSSNASKCSTAEYENAKHPKQVNTDPYNKQHPGFKINTKNAEVGEKSGTQIPPSQGTEDETYNYPSQQNSDETIPK